MKRSVAVALCVVLWTAIPAWAWNYAGHRAIAFLAYSHLTPRVKQRVDLILRAHPDFPAVLSKGKSSQPWDVARNSFVTAATWPDLIRNDDRFSDDGKGPAPPGFSDSGRHTDWHFINIPWPSEFSSQPVAPINAATQIKALLKQLKSSGPVDPAMAYALPWLVHIVSDLHQPLHALTRFADHNGKPVHDKGGNGCYVEPGRNLHSFWDGSLGRDDSEGGVARLAASLMDEVPMPSKVDVNPETWIREAQAVAGSHVYALGDCSHKDAPLELPLSYRQKAERLAHDRAASAAYRLAKMINDRLGR